MKILFRHKGILPVEKYGGIERILYWHMLELVKEGHQVTLIGHPRSQVSERGIRLIPQREENWYRQIPSDIDLIHLFYNEVPPVDIPTVNTIGGNGRVGEEFPHNTVFVSRKHASNHGSEVFVYNGVRLEEYPWEPKKRTGWSDFLFLAKTSWRVKNLKDALRACKRAKKHLHIAGGRSWWPSRYVHNYGMVGGGEKLAIIRRCDALLFPVRWPEPFGIAIIEAMSQGLPVIGPCHGSLPELITPATGVLCRHFRQFAEVVEGQSWRDWNPQAIREYVETHFNITSFTRSYLKIFQQVARGERLNSVKPSWQFPDRAEALLDF